MPSTSHFYIQRQYTLWNAAISSAWTDGVAILSTGEEDNGAVDAKDCNKLMLYLNVSMGDSNRIDIKVLFSDTNLDSIVFSTVWYPRTDGTIVAGVNTLSAYYESVTVSGQYRIPITIMDKYIKIQARGHGDLNGSALAIEGFVGTA